MPSFFKSTLSLAFIICVVTVIIMIFTGKDMPEYGDKVIIGIITAYLTARGSNQFSEKEVEKEENEDIHSLTSLDGA